MSDFQSRQFLLQDSAGHFGFAGQPLRLGYSSSAACLAPYWQPVRHYWLDLPLESHRPGYSCFPGLLSFDLPVASTGPAFGHPAFGCPGFGCPGFADRSAGSTHPAACRFGWAGPSGFARQSLRGPGPFRSWLVPRVLAGLQDLEFR